jgi:hypothetical protein
MRILYVSALSLGLVLAACGGGNTAPPSTPGSAETAKTTTLETGAAALQAKPPVDRISMYLDGFHAAKDDASMQMEAHHYCNQLNEDFAQCVLFDGNTADARLVGIEYIVSEKLYKTLPAQEKAYWHPHNYEILSGTLRMPGLPDAAEKEALKGKINSYGKTWHTWMSGVHGRSSDELPFGPPHLQWSFNHDGEIAPELVQQRDERMNLSTADTRSARADLASLAHAQGGVDALAGRFPNAAGTLPGVTDNGDLAARPVPTFGFSATPATPTGR